MRITATVNGQRVQADDVWEGENLLFVLRERMGMPGSKKTRASKANAGRAGLPGRRAGLRLPGARPARRRAATSSGRGAGQRR